MPDSRTNIFPELVNHNETLQMRDIIPNRVYRLKFAHPSEKITIDGLPSSIEFQILYDWNMPSKNHSENHQFIWQNSSFWLDGRLITMSETPSLDIRWKYFAEKSEEIRSMMVDIDKPYIVFVNVDRETYPVSENFTDLQITITNHGYNLKNGDHYKYSWAALNEPETL